MSADNFDLPAELRKFYSGGEEQGRLNPGGSGSGELEKIRTQETLKRLLPPPPETILDIGGGAGVYGLWLASLGYTVHLIDIVPLHVELAQVASAAQTRPLASATVGDARKVDFASGSADAVLLLGPLYHLLERDDRVAALREAGRVLKPGGKLFCAAVSRFASLCDGLRKGYIHDPVFWQILQRDLAEGQHRNPTNHPEYFMPSYFHRPDELKLEIAAAGLRHEATIAVEGPAWLTKNFTEQWEDPAKRPRILELLRQIESEPTLIGASAHLLGIAAKN